MTTRNSDTLSDVPQFAPEYTLYERLRLLILLGVPSLGLMAALEYGLLPWLKTWLINNPCGEVFGFDAQAVSLYALFGLPMLFGVAGAWVMLRDALRILRDGQVPPRGVRVWRRTPIRRGMAARRVAYLRLAAFVVSVLCVGYCLTLALNLVDSFTHDNPARCAQPPKPLR